jgi:hypothetical protein
VAATESNFTDPVASGDSVANQWSDIVPAIKGLLALWRMKYISGVEPSDLLNGLYFSNGSYTYGWCLRTSGVDFVIQENVGVDAKHPGGTWQGRGIFASGVGLAIPATSVTSATFADARIASSNVTQHEGDIDHDALVNFVANEHKDHSSITLTAGTGIDGGGDLTSSRTFDLADTAVTPGSYADSVVTVDQQGRITAATALTPVTTYKVAGDQTVAGAATETNITELTALAFPNGTASGEKYVISATVPVSANGTTINWGRLKLYVGANGNLTDGAAGRKAWGNHGYIVNGAETAVYITEVLVAPASGNKFGLSYESPAANTDIKGDNATHEQAYVTVRRVL